MIVQQGCIFCGSQPLTREHVFPKWVSKTLQTSPRGKPPLRIDQIRGNDTERRTFYSSIAIDTVAKCICKKCNNGWLSDVERDAKRHIEAMVNGETVSLNTNEQALVATWAGLKAILVRYSHSPPPPIDREWLEWVYKHRSVPEEWFVWVGKYDGRLPYFYEAHDIHSFELRSNYVTGLVISSPEQHGVLLTFAIGYLAVKILGIRGFLPGYPQFDSLQYLSPSFSSQLNWPPSTVINDSSIISFFEMWGDTKSMVRELLNQ